MILAHGAGIDDAAFFVLPVLVFVAIRWLNRRDHPARERSRSCQDPISPPAQVKGSQ